MRFREAQKHCYQHHGEREPCRSPHHRPSASETVKEEGWDERSEEKHGLYETTNEQGQVVREPDVVLQCRGNVVDDEVDASDLIHELHAVCQEHSSSGLHVIPLEKLAPLVFAVQTLQMQGVEDVFLLSDNLFVGGATVVDVAQDLKGFLVTAFGVEIARRLGYSEDYDHDNNSEDDLATYWKSPCNGA